jgi:uncharacterized YigZ family protein
MIYKTINKAVTAELIIKKSRFISVLIPLSQLQDVEKVLYDVKQKYPKANHYCFAYIIRQDRSALERCSDDGEPSGTAGWPLLNVLKKRELENIMAIVVRYFGGTLLGTGGLVKAYTQTVQSALDGATTVNMEYSQNLMVRFNYSHYGSFENIFFNIMNQVTDIQYSDMVSLKIWIAVDNVNDFIEKVDQLTGRTAIIDRLEEGFISHTIRS